LIENRYAVIQITQTDKLIARVAGLVMADEAVRLCDNTATACNVGSQAIELRSDYWSRNGGLR
jgi:hypothetical protein